MSRRQSLESEIGLNGTTFWATASNKNQYNWLIPKIECWLENCYLHTLHRRSAANDQFCSSKNQPGRAMHHDKHTFMSWKYWTENRAYERIAGHKVTEHLLSKNSARHLNEWQSTRRERLSHFSSVVAQTLPIS